MRKFTLCMLACCSVAASLYAQDVPVNREKYPDYVDPQKAYPAEPRLMKFVPVEGESQSRKAALAKAASELPEYWNNADTKYFPPVFNQDGGSCGSASRICYMFTHEINALRDRDASLPENQYPSHFVWLLTSGNSGKDDFVEYVGVPNVKVYGGRTYSSLFGYQEETNNDFGWMTGYDKWMNAIGNRMMKPTSMPQSMETEAGRTAAKMWLYNHAGDMDFKAGGLIGLGVASGGQWHDIPKTDANDAAGVTGMKYVYRWGTQVDHAVTMVGWDDRIEFDLDGNGVAGELDKDEKGAWIIVNSWSAGWCNQGFIYCPYKYAGPVSDPTTGAMTGGYWWGELYHARKDFRPTRVIKLKMDYTHRSELLLQVGISSDVNATEPEVVMDMHHFRYAGDGANGDANPVPATPMLGNWNGKMNHAPMEFCYDLTDLSANFDTNKPLKYFFIINRKKDTSNGSGNIYEASIMDMEYDQEGIESPFDLGGEKFQITTKGKKTMITSVVYGMGYQPVTNLILSDGTLSWNAPMASSFKVNSYNVYKDGVLLGNTTDRSMAVTEGKEYSVSVVYEGGIESAKVTCKTAIEQNGKVLNFDCAGFTIPNVFANHYNECTIEFFIKPTVFQNWNCAAGPGWGTYMHHLDASGYFTCGWNTNARMTTNATLSKSVRNHIAIVVKGNRMSVYKDGSAVGSFTSTSYSGLGGFGDLVFRSDNGNNSWQQAQYDEIRIWNYARSAEEIRGGSSAKKVEFFGEVMPKGLLVYYKGDTFMGADGKYYMRDCIGNNHATIQASGDPSQETGQKSSTTGLTPTLTLDTPQNVYVGVPVSLEANYNDAINKLTWSVPSCNISEMNIKSPTVVFSQAGEHKVTVKGTAYDGTELLAEITIDVKAAPELDASFSMNTERLPMGEHLSVWANTYVDGCSYEWLMPGAETEKAYGVKAGATYQEGGIHYITLKVTSADGRSVETTQEIRVTSIPPVADFSVSNAFVLKETPITLESTSKYSPTSYEWTIAGQARKTTITNAAPQQTWTPMYPGKYNITLKAANHMGSHSVTKEKALVVLNDDSKNGLSFSQNSAKVSVPNSTNLLAFTIEFWANPSSLSDFCWGMGDKTENLLLKVNASGALITTIKGKVFTSNAGFFKAGEWNHYAIRRTLTGQIFLYRNGVEFQNRKANVDKTAITDLTTFTLGVDGMPMNGSIDEFRIWGSNYTGIAKTCNQHLENPELYVENNNLLVYYDFNQSGGNVIDRSGNGKDGVRSGFGPDGDAWGLSTGVFSLYLGDVLPDETITAIDEVWTDESVTAGRAGVYTLSGQYVGKTIEGLPAGIYIVDGKKVVVK